MKKFSFERLTARLEFFVQLEEKEISMIEFYFFCKTTNYCSDIKDKLLPSLCFKIKLKYRLFKTFSINGQ